MRVIVAAGMYQIAPAVDGPLMSVCDVRERIPVDIAVLDEKSQPFALLEGSARGPYFNVELGWLSNLERLNIDVRMKRAIGQALLGIDGPM